MYSRSVNSSLAMQSSQELLNMAAPTGGTGNMFAGGAGEVSIGNTTSNFICAGAEGKLNIANTGDNAIIQGGNSGNYIINVGDNSYIKGSEDVDIIFSIGEDCEIETGGGNDRLAVSGAGTTVNGGAGDDIITGTIKGLDRASLKRLDVISLMSKIMESSIPYLELEPLEEETSAEQ